MATNQSADGAPPTAGIFGTKDLEGKVAIVTGGSRGIGKQIAIHLATRGANVIVNYNSGKDAAEAVEQEAEKGGLVVHAVQVTFGLQNTAYQSYRCNCPALSVHLEGLDRADMGSRVGLRLDTVPY